MKYLSVLVLLLIISCNRSKDEAISIDSTNVKEIQTITEEVYKGNINSYKKLKNIYLGSNSGDFLFWSMFMANKYDYPLAYLDVFYSITNQYITDVKEFDKIDENTKKIALSYLVSASEKGVKEATTILESLKN